MCEQKYDQRFVKRGFRAAALDLSVTFLFLNGPPLAIGRLWSSHLQAGNLCTNRFHGNRVWRSLHIKNRQAVWVFSNGSRSVQGLPNCDAHTHMHKVTARSQTLPCIDAQAYACTQAQLVKPADMHGLTVGQCRGGLRPWIIGVFVSYVINLAAVLR